MIYPSPLVSTEWLADHLADPQVRVLDASWYLPQSGRNGKLEYAAGHIPGAVFCDLEKLSDPETELPHMLPSPARFAVEVGGMGISNDSFVVVYDGSGQNMTAPRIWWMFRFFGHASVAVLDGGLKKWRAEAWPLESGIVSVRPQAFRAEKGWGEVRTMESLKENLITGREQVVDARSRGRFAGTEPEPRSGLRGGHIAGSYNLPYQELLAADGTLLPPDELRGKFEQAGIDLTRPIVTTCGSGVTACVILLGLDALKLKAAALYDGSWSEWGRV
jgi:thiosulfate/3-mercaptopyruvate sulfurtransferase